MKQRNMNIIKKYLPDVFVTKKSEPNFKAGDWVFITGPHNKDILGIIIQRAKESFGDAAWIFREERYVKSLDSSHDQVVFERLHFIRKTSVAN